MKNPEPNPEDEAFEELALKQGHWQYTSGWRKKQIVETDMKRDEVDIMWQQAMRESIKNNEMYTRYYFAKLVAEKALAGHAMREVQRLGQEIEQEKALQALHNENERLVLYKDAYAEPESECNPQDLCAGCRCKYAYAQTEQERDEILQAITDPENQPSQFGTVTLEYHQEKMKQWEDLFDRMSANFERVSEKVLEQRSLRELARRIVPLYTISQQRTEQNFCSRCGKRTKDLTHIHTCTPPQD